MNTLKDAKIGSAVKVVKLHGEGAVKRRIMDMGITKGVEVLVRKVVGGYLPNEDQSLETQYDVITPSSSLGEQRTSATL